MRCPCVACRNDEQAFKKTDTAQRRAEIERRAQERAESEAQRLREQAAASAREEREAKLNALHDLNLQVGPGSRGCCMMQSLEVLRRQMAGNVGCAGALGRWLAGSPRA
jgi:hypothetical protein